MAQNKCPAIFHKAPWPRSDKQSGDGKFQPPRRQISSEIKKNKYKKTKQEQAEDKLTVWCVLLNNLWHIPKWDAAAN